MTIYSGGQSQISSTLLICPMNLKKISYAPQMQYFVQTTHGSLIAYFGIRPTTRYSYDARIAAVALILKVQTEPPGTNNETQSADQSASWGLVMHISWFPPRHMFRKGENGERSQKMEMQDYQFFLLQFFRPTAFASAVNLILFAFVPRPLKSKLGKAILKGLGEEQLSNVLDFRWFCKNATIQ